MVEPTRRVMIEHDGEFYSWSEQSGFVDQYWERPSRTIEVALQAKLEEVLHESDAELSDSRDLVRAASAARDQGHLSRAESLARRALEKHPEHHAAATVLSAVLRARRKPHDALVVTEPFLRTGSAALLTTRAAALLDIGRPREVRKLLNRAWAIAKARGESPGETSLVYKRLEKEFSGA